MRKMIFIYYVVILLYGLLWRRADKKIIGGNGNMLFIIYRVISSWISMRRAMPTVVKTRVASQNMNNDRIMKHNIFFGS